MTRKITERVFDIEEQVAELSILALDSASDLGAKIDKQLLRWLGGNEKHPVESFLIENSCPRFTSGDGKGIIHNTVRGSDLYILADVGNYSCKYTLFGQEVPMSPDEHFQDIKRIIQAAGGKAHRITLITPILYGGRQHKRNNRESLDCANALQEFERMGIKNIVTFDAHDNRVQNAVPLMGFDNVFPTYQVLKALFKKVPDLKIDRENLMIISPDEGALNRNIYYSSVMSLDLGMFYKRRDYANVVNGRNQIIAHEYLGASVEGKDIFINDDIIASGDSMLEVAYELKKRKAKRIFCSATYTMFTSGIECFQKAYEDGVISAVVGTNLTYLKPELKQVEWFIEADLSKYIAYIIAALNHDLSISLVIDPFERIKKLLENYKSK